MPGVYLWLHVVVHRQPERDIIGRATSVIYNFNNYYFDNSRWFLPIR